MNGGDHGRLLYASNHAFIDGPRCCDAQRMAIQTSFAKKVAGSEHCNHRFLALLGNDGEFDLALLDVKNRVRDLSLRKNNLILPIFGYRFSLAHLGEKYFGIKRGCNPLPHNHSPLSSPIRTPFFPDEGSATQTIISNSNRLLPLPACTHRGPHKIAYSGGSPAVSRAVSR